MARKEIEDFFNEISGHFFDPLTGVVPTGERELNSVLAIQHQYNNIDWSKVEVLQIPGYSAKKGASILINDKCKVISEFPLFTRTDEAVKLWGAMAADLIFIDLEERVFTLVECKVDSHFTYNDFPPLGQLSRYLEYLRSLKAKKVFLYLICPKCNIEWYGERLEQAIEHFREKYGRKIDSFMSSWESIIDACSQLPFTKGN